MSERPYDWRWRIMQHVGPTQIPAAGGVCADRKTMLREAGHYAALYAEEGAVELQTRTGKNRWRRHNP